MHQLARPLAALVNAAYNNTFPSGYINLRNIPNKFGWVMQPNEVNTVLPSSSIVVAIRGTKTRVDVFADAEVEKVETPLGNVHAGFWETYNLIRDPILEALDQYARESAIYVTGHSLGGALASLLTADLMNNHRYTNIVEYTFASPKVGDKTFVEKYNTNKPNTFRYVNTNDLIPKSPIGLDYEHVRQPIEFNAGTELSLMFNHELYTYMDNVVKL